nr:uncharacterized protein LOC117859269 [Setaria viridis]
MRCRTAMAAHPFDLNLEPPPVLDLNNPIDCNDIPDWDAPAHELDFEGDGEEQGDGVASEGGDENAAGQQDDANEQDVVGSMGHGVGGNAAADQGSNVKKRRYYSDELKVAIYLELLAKTHPPDTAPWSFQGCCPEI